MARPKGSKNQKTIEVEMTAKRLGCDPFEILCHFANGNWKALGYENELYFTERPDGFVKAGYVITPEMRLHAAKEATAYIYSKKKTVEEEKTDNLMRIVLEDYGSKKK